MRPFRTLTAIASTMLLSIISFSAKSEPATSAHSFSFIGMKGELLHLSQFRGKLLLVVNTASQCGFTSQYEGLEALHQRYRDRGLVIVGVPSNDFGNQEPGNNQEIAEFTRSTYRISFPLAQKEVITGSRAHPFYRWVSAEAGPLGAPKWNFHKYLIGANGQLIDWYASTTSPSSSGLIKAIEANLPPKE